MKPREGALVDELLAELRDNVWSGIFRPGSWERAWLVQAVGEERLQAILDELEPTPGEEWRLRAKRGGR